MTNAPVTIQKVFCVLLLLLASVHANAQKGKKETKEKIPVYNYVIDDPMDVFGRQPVPADVVRNVWLPEFYHRGTTKSKDTSLKYECYDAANKIINPDTLQDPAVLRFVSLIQYYTDPAHSYRTDDGKLLPIPTEKIIARYDKTGKDKWLSVDYATNKSTILQEHMSEIVRTDSSVVQDPVKGNATITVYKYYRVSATK